MKKILKKSSLMMNYTVILCIVIVIIVSSLVINYLLINQWYHQESVKNREERFEQAVSSIQEYEDSIKNLEAEITLNDTIIDYLNSELLAGRSSVLKKFYKVTANMMTLNNSIQAVSIYDTDDKLVASKGTLFIPMSDKFQEKKQLRFSDLLSDKAGRVYFQVIMPAYQMMSDGNFIHKGNVVLLFDTVRLIQMLELVIDGDEYIEIRDAGGQNLIHLGQSDMLTEYNRSNNKEKDYLVFEQNLTYSDWEIRYISQKSVIQRYMNRMQKANIITDILIIISLLFITLLLYVNVIRPIRRQMNFVMGYVRDTNQRISVVENNEFGELACKINEMLDGIEALNIKILKSKEKYLELEYQKKRTEMIAYKSQLNPHFMYNTLDCIRGMALYKEEREIASLTGALSQMFRYIVKGDEIVSIRDDLKNLRRYAMIIDYRFMGEYKIIEKVDKDIEDIKIPKMIIQPLLENAVLHGLEPKPQKGMVTITIREHKDNDIMITVSDDGCGMTKEVLQYQRECIYQFNETGIGHKHETGIGLANVYKRLKLFYDDHVLFEIDSEWNKGTTVTIVIPQSIDFIERRV